MLTNSILFLAIFLISMSFFGWSCFRRFRLITLGKAENRFDHLGKRIMDLFLYSFAQRCSISGSYRFGVNHAILFWSFMVLMVANTEFLLAGIFPDYINLANLPTGLYYAIALIFDIVSLLALLAVLTAAGRRLFFPPKYIEARTRDSFFILGMVAVLMLAFFGLHGSEIAQGSESAALYMPISSFVASSILPGASTESLISLANISWWVHAIVLLGFLNYLPYSKHMHILTIIPNNFFKRLTKMSLQPREEFKKGNVFGVGQVDQFTWKALFDSYCCTECGRCSDLCPATSTNKPLNPRLVIHDIKENLLMNGPLLISKKQAKLPLIGGGQDGSIDEEVIWECTTCGACMKVCPAFIEHVPRITDMRRNLVEMKAKFPEELLNFFENMEQRSNPWGIAPSERIKWAAGTNVQPFEAGKTECLFFVGCAGAFDARSRHVTLAVARILDSAGVSWGILGKDEPCCGDSLRRLGNEYVFDRMVKENIEMFKEKGVRKIITQCPHCYHTLMNDYRQYGIELEVIHHTGLINTLIKEGKLELDQARDLGNIVFHDSCYLGRYNNIYKAPREAIALATNQAPVEMERHHDRSFCCGAGGGRMWMEEKIGKHINVLRVEEAMKENPQDHLCLLPVLYDHV
ncbi:MAG: (Fe-S)-binding protein [Dehalococcoidales bacterium]|nr:(Fe-S)-binding protein [Dehalococcoidales bacterium]